MRCQYASGGQRENLHHSWKSNSDSLVACLIAQTAKVPHSPHVTQVQGTKIFLKNQILNRVRNQHFGELLYLKQPDKQLNNHIHKILTILANFFTP